MKKDFFGRYFFDKNELNNRNDIFLLDLSQTIIYVFQNEVYRNKIDFFKNEVLKEKDFLPIIVKKIKNNKFSLLENIYVLEENRTRRFKKDGGHHRIYAFYELSKPIKAFIFPDNNFWIKYNLFFRKRNFLDLKVV